MPIRVPIFAVYGEFDETPKRHILGWKKRRLKCWSIRYVQPFLL